MNPPSVPRIAALAVVVRDGRALLVRRRLEPDADLWGFPGGHVDLGETVAECAVRELVEETGISAAAGQLLTTIDVIRRGERGRTRFHFVLVAVSCDYLSGEPEAADDVAEARWVSVDEVAAGTLPMSRHVGTVIRLAGCAPRTDGGLLLDLI